MAGLAGGRAVPPYLLILRATDLLTPTHGGQTATEIALGLYTAYNIAATIASFPAGRLADRLGDRGPRLVVTHL